MKPFYKLKSWVPIPFVSENNDNDCNCDWMDFWIGLTHNKSPGIENFLGKEIFDYALFYQEEQHDFDVIDFWRGISSNNQMTDFLLKNFNETFDGETSIGENIRWKYLFEHNDSPFVVDFCKKYPEKICWDSVCKNDTNDSLIAYAGGYPQYLNWDYISMNSLPSAVYILKKYPDKVTDNIVYNENPDAFELLENKRKEIRWDILAKHCPNYPSYPNRNIVKLFEKYFDEMETYINWKWWSKSSDAISLLEKNHNKIIWQHFCCNDHPKAIKMIKKNKDKIDWEALCRNKSPDIVDFLDDNLEKLCLDVLMYTCHPNCIKIIEKYWNNKDFTFLFGNRTMKKYNNIHENVPNKFLEMGPYGQYIERVALQYYESFAERPECAHLLKDAFENKTHLKVMEECSNFYRGFYSNPAIFELDTDAMKAQNKSFAEELMAKVFHPTRVKRMIEKYGYNILTEELCYQSDTNEE